MIKPNKPSSSISIIHKNFVHFILGWAELSWAKLSQAELSKLPKRELEFTKGFDWIR